MELLRRTSSVEPVSTTVERWPWSVIENGETSLDLVACEILMSRGGIEIKPHEPKYPNKYLWVFASKNNWILLDKLKKENEYNVLQNAIYGVSELGVVGIPTKWTDETKRRVVGLFWQKRSDVLMVLKDQCLLDNHDTKEGTPYWEHLVKVDELEAAIIGAKGMSLKVLSANPPLSPSDITGLVRDMITTVEEKHIKNIK